MRFNLCCFCNVTLLGAMLVLSACGMIFGDHTLDWEEDVLLDDGTPVRIKRHVEFNDYNSLAQDSYGAVESAATLQLQGQFAALPIWSAPLIPLVLYRSSSQQHEWVIVATTGSCEVWRAGGKPLPPYWEYRSGEGSWHATALSSESIGKETNLLSGYHKGLPARLATIEIKQRDMANPRISKRFQQIVGSVIKGFCNG